MADDSPETAPEVGPSAELGAKLHDLLYLEAAERRDFDAELAALEERYGQALYRELLFLLSHLRFEPDEAKLHWRQIVEHRGLMQEKLGSFVDPRVALISYFVQVQRKFENPTIIEMRLFQQTEAYAYRDELTGLRNYRFFSETLPQEVLRADQYGAPLSLVMIDIDDFKLYNDRHGHEAGNAVLSKIGELLSSVLRKVDVAARYGGEEFALLVPSTPKTGARLVAERVREAVESQRFAGEESQPGGSLTVSLGIATYPGDCSDAAGLVRRADRAMYLAKSSGKNQCRLYGSNRRSFPRVEAALTGELCLLQSETRPLTTLNVSEGGIRFVTVQELAVDQLLDVQLDLPGEDRRVALAGRVVSTTKAAGGKLEAAIRIIDISSPDQRALASFVRGTRQARG